MQFAPAPTVVSYLVPTAGFVALIAGIAVIEECAEHAGGGPGLRPRRVSIPAHTRKPFALISLAMLTAWAVAGLYMSLVPSVLAGVLDVPSHLVAGIAIAVIFGAAPLAQLTLGRMDAHRLTRLGVVTALAGLAAVYTAVTGSSVVAFFAGSVILGGGMGATFLGVIRLRSELAEPKRRSELFSALYVVNYPTLAVPVILPGVRTDVLGLATMTTSYVVVVAVVGLAALAGLRRDAQPGRMTPACAPAAHGRPSRYRSPGVVRRPPVRGSPGRHTRFRRRRRRRRRRTPS